MHSKKLLISFCILLSGAITIPQMSFAQWSIGASYEIRQEDPTNGFGVRLERQILKPIPIVDLGLRAHFSYFSEENNISSNGATYSQKLENYDFGLAAIGGVSVGLVKPYVGLGLGSTTFDLSTEDFPDSGPQQEPDDSESKVFWNALVGAEVKPIPLLTPFVEYRFQQVDEPEFAPGSTGRLIFGLSLSF